MKAFHIATQQLIAASHFSEWSSEKWFQPQRLDKDAFAGHVTAQRFCLAAWRQPMELKGAGNAEIAGLHV